MSNAHWLFPLSPGANMEDLLVTILAESKKKQSPLFKPSPFGQLELSRGQRELSRGQRQPFCVRNC
jgi:hypothetical protein